MSDTIYDYETQRPFTRKNLDSPDDPDNGWINVHGQDKDAAKIIEAQLRAQGKLHGQKLGETITDVRTR